MAITWIHSGDLHLGRTMSLPPLWAEQNQARRMPLIDDTKEAFFRLIDVCIDKNVDFLLLSGDVFDSHEKNVEAYEWFLYGMKKLQENDIMVYMIAGNHDPKGRFPGFLKLPDNVFFFDTRWESALYHKGGEPLVNLMGISYQKERETKAVTLPASLFREDLKNIVLLHTGLTDKNYMPITVRDLAVQGEKADYIALGHIHHGEEVLSSPRAYYPGAIQGTAPGEDMVGHCLYVTLTDGAPQVEAIPLTSTVYRTITISLEGPMKNQEELTTSIIESLEEHTTEDGHTTFLRLNVVAPWQDYYELKSQLEQEKTLLSITMKEVAEEIRTPYYLHSLKVRFVPHNRGEDLLSQEMATLIDDVWSSFSDESLKKGLPKAVFFTEDVEWTPEKNKLPFTEEEWREILEDSQSLLKTMLEEVLSHED